MNKENRKNITSIEKFKTIKEQKNIYDFLIFYCGVDEKKIDLIKEVKSFTRKRLFEYRKAVYRGYIDLDTSLSLKKMNAVLKELNIAKDDVIFNVKSAHIRFKKAGHENSPYAKFHNFLSIDKLTFNVDSVFSSNDKKENVKIENVEIIEAEIIPDKKQERQLTTEGNNKNVSGQLSIYDFPKDKEEMIKEIQVNITEDNIQKAYNSLEDKVLVSATKNWNEGRKGDCNDDLILLERLSKARKARDKRGNTGNNNELMQLLEKVSSY